MERTTWLDGLRGLASIGVVICHATNFEPTKLRGILYRSYWNDPPEENRHFLQIPPINLLFKGASMVSLFFVISGYAISLPLLRSRDGSATSIPFFRRLSSTATRRPFRIYLPSTLVYIITQLIFFLGLFRFEPTLSNDYYAGLRPHSSPLLHVKYVVWCVIHSLDISNHGVEINTNTDRPDFMNFTTQLWTMPLEWRGSCMVYFTILTMAFWRDSTRRFTLIIIAAYWFYVGQWDLFAFIGGLFLAERHVALESPSSNGEIHLPCDDQVKKLDIPLAWKVFISSPYFRMFYTSCCFIFGVYLMCIGNERELTIEHRWLLYIQPGYWDDAEFMTRCWRTLGALLVVYAIGRSSFLQYALNTRPAQYLGKVSFAVYLLHLNIWYSIKIPTRDAMWYFITHEPYPGTEEAMNRPLAFWPAWWGAILTCTVIMFVVAHLWSKFIDKKSLQVGRKFDKWVNVT